MAAAVAVALVLLASCAGSPDGTSSADPAAPSSAPTSSESAEAQRFPDVLDARLTPSGDDYTISVTISSPYDTPDRYADGWRVLTPEGDVLAEHQLAHDHAAEQPFTRTSAAFAIPDDVDEVTVEGRDLENGYGGETVIVDVPR